MTNTLLTLKKPIDQSTLDVLLDVHRITIRCGVNYVLVGARARDLILHHGYGAPIRRATMDIDFALQVRDWKAFYKVRDTLLANGYSATSTEHRLLTHEGGTIDIVPFGDIASQSSMIAWPPKGTTEMNVIGFEESYQSACVIRIGDEPTFELRVANPEGLMIMKLIAWTERDPIPRRKDAADIAYLLQYYERIDADRNTLYEAPWFSTLEHYGYDIPLASAHLFGHRVQQIAHTDTLVALGTLFNDEIRGKSTDVLLREMTGDHAIAFEALLDAFMAGLKTE